MQQDDQKQERDTPMRPPRPLHPSRDFFSDWVEDEQPDDEDVAWQPTLVLKRIKRSQSRPTPAQGKDTPPPVRQPARDMPQPQLSATPLAKKSVPTRKLRDDFYGDEELSGDLLDSSLLSTAHLMRLSGMMRAVHPPEKTRKLEEEKKEREVVEEWWPEGIKQTGPFPVVNLYGKEPFGLSEPHLPVVTVPSPPALKAEPKWKTLLNSPTAKVCIGLVAGIALLYLVSKFVDIPATINILKEKLTTPAGITFALLSGVAFLTAFSVRGVRWKLFLNPIGKVSTSKAIQLFLVGNFLNFLLPVRGGEVAKSLMLKRIANIPISKSLPTVAMDKALDLMPALFIMAIVPLLGVKMDIKLWLVLGMVGGLLICLISFVVLAAWKRTAAVSLLQRMTNILPKGIGQKVEGFATGFVDALLAGASQPRIFLPAVLLTVIAVTCDGLFAMLAFWTVGVPISFGTAIFGYTVYNMFYILPTPPGQVGSNEAIGLLVFYGLLHLKADGVTAMFFFSHPWAALLMCGSGMGCLSALGLTISSAMKVQTSSEEVEEQPQAALEEPAEVEARV